MISGSHSVYVRKGKVIAPSIAETSSGYMDVEPVRIVDCRDADAIAAIVRTSLAAGNRKERGYLRHEFPEPVVLKVTNSRSWNEFAKSTVMIGWEVTAEQVVITRVANLGSRRDEEHTPVVIEIFPASGDKGRIVDAIVRCVREACRAT